MGLRAHVRQLNLKHSDLDKEITLEMKRKNPDMFRISQLKKEKLRLKDILTVYANSRTG